jgi:general secretion pathway protein H
VYCHRRTRVTNNIGNTHSPRGFSLLELMLVIVVIGILVSIFTLSIGAYDDDDTAEHVRRLETLITLASEEAAMQGREIGLRFYQHGYEFAARVPDVDEEGQQIWTWVPLEEDRLLRPRDLGEDIYVELIIEGKVVDLDYARADLNEEDIYQPQIYLFSSGDLLPPFEARFRPAFANTAILLSVTTELGTEVVFDDF